jgi:FAD:protein FMN transferase
MTTGLRSLGMTAGLRSLGMIVCLATQLFAQERREYRELHMGMEVRIVLFATDSTRARAAARAAFDRIAELEDIMSDYRPGSELRRLDGRPGEWVSVSEPLFHVVTRAVEVAAATEGAFDPTVGPLVALWREARRSKWLPPPRALDSARALVGWKRIGLDSAGRRVRLELPGMHLDLGGVAKGYILQRAMAVLRDRGFVRAMIVAGGDIAMAEGPPGQAGWVIWLPDSVVTAVNVAWATSGADFQSVEISGVRYSHVIDPRTGVALTNDYTASVMAADGALADALATALTVLGPENVSAVLRRYPGVIARVIRNPP